jgi:hypothetical protein
LIKSHAIKLEVNILKIQGSQRPDFSRGERDT